MPEQLAIKG
ncbi:hypothetical protein D043_0056B, partial [Vibrio parahaemolyticus EKP-021]